MRELLDETMKLTAAVENSTDSIERYCTELKHIEEKFRDLGSRLMRETGTQVDYNNHSELSYQLSQMKKEYKGAMYNILCSKLASLQDIIYNLEHSISSTIEGKNAISAMIRAQKVLESYDRLPLDSTRYEFVEWPAEIQSVLGP